MKKIIIPILALIVIVAAYFLFTAEKEKPVEIKEVDKPTIGPVEDSLYPGAELVAQVLGDYGNYNYYAVDAPLSELISFYEGRFSDFKVEVYPSLGFWRAANHEMAKLQEELWGTSAFETWKELEKGMVLSVFITPYGSPAYEDENRELLEEFDNKFKEKILVAIGYL